MSDVNVTDEWNDMFCLDQSFYILLVVDSQQGEEVETGTTYPSLADQCAGSERLLVVVKVIDDGVDKLWRQLSSTVFISTATLLNVIEILTVQRCECLQRPLVHSS